MAAVRRPLRVTNVTGVRARSRIAKADDAENPAFCGGS